MAEKAIGASVRRIEDRRFVSGAGRYTDDLNRPGQAHAYFLRSPHAHARITAIEMEAAKSAAGVLGIFTATDIDADGLGDIGILVSDKFGAQSKSPTVVPPRRPLNGPVLRHVGDPFAIVIAETADQAKDAAEKIAVDYEVLPALATITQADAKDAPRIWDQAPGNICIEHEFGDQSAADAVFAAAAHVASLDFVNNRVVSNPMEPRAAIGEYDDLDDRLTLYCTSQSPHMTQIMLAEDVFHVPARQLRVVSHDVGGGFGTRGMVYPEEAVLLWAARRLRRAVKWTGERSEIFLSDSHGRDHVSHVELALDSDGRFLGLRLDLRANIGAYVSTFGAVVPVMHQSILSAGTYDIPAIYGNVRAMFTNTVPVDAYRGAGRPETSYMIERIVDCAAHDLGIDKADIRRRNIIAAANLPYQSPLGLVYVDSDFPRILEMALAEADYAGFEARRETARANGKLRGIGMASYVEVTGWAPSDMTNNVQRFGAYETAEIRFDAEGGVMLKTGTHSHGQGLDTAFAQIVADGLGVPVDRVQSVHGDTDVIAFGRGTAGSRSLIAGGAAISVAIDKIVDKGKKIAAHMLETAPADIEFTEGNFTVAGTDRRIGIREVAREAYYPGNYPLSEMEPGLEETGYWDPPGPNFPNGCQVCEVEIDPATGTVEVIGIVSADDFGVVVNPMIVEGQVQGGIVQGIGQALMECGVYDPDSGQLLSGSFQDYCMPRADDLPFITVVEEGIPSRTNPLGVKGCGEAGTVGAAPAITNAVVDALAPMGLRHLDMPHTPERVWQAIRNDGARR